MNKNTPQTIEGIEATGQQAYCTHPAHIGVVTSEGEHAAKVNIGPDTCRTGGACEYLIAVPPPSEFEVMFLTGEES